MIFKPTAIAGVVVIEPERHGDARGHFARTYCADDFQANGLDPRIAQCSTSFNAKAGTLRGLHFQREPHAEVKLVRCTRGAIFDVAVDLRPDSPTYRRWMGRELTADEGAMLYVPEGCAHGYLTLSDDTEVTYFASTFYAPGSARGVRFDDPAFGIEWPAPALVVSDQDRQWPDFSKGENR